MGKERKNPKNQVFTLKMEIFPEIGPRKIFLVPQIRRQVSAHAYIPTYIFFYIEGALYKYSAALHNILWRPKTPPFQCLGGRDPQSSQNYNYILEALLNGSPH